jgi:hypothetical protein
MTNIIYIYQDIFITTLYCHVEYLFPNIIPVENPTEILQSSSYLRINYDLKFSTLKQRLQHNNTFSLTVSGYSITRSELFRICIRLISR